MKVTLVSMVKNEIDIISDFCAHVLDLFDQVVIIDHLSKDGTFEYLKRLKEDHDSLEIYEFTELGYFQSQLMTWVVQNLDVCINADWIFILDADEFLPFGSKEELMLALDEYKMHPIIRMRWLNLVPKVYNNKSGSYIDSEYYLPKKSSWHAKIAFQPSLIPVKDYVVAQGNHSILAAPGAGALPAKSAFNIYHLPIRSPGQLSLKILQGINSYLMMGESRDKALGLHWFQIGEIISNNGISDGLLNGLVVHYGEHASVDDVRYSSDELLKLGYQQVPLKIAKNSSVVSVSSNYDINEVLVKTMMSFMTSSATTEFNNISMQFRLINENQIAVRKGANMQKFASLEQLEEGVVNGHNITSWLDDFGLVSAFLEPSYMDIETLTPTAWGGHIPFMFCLVNLLKPRIYVELGSHHGASFFAACQALKLLEGNHKAIAIDLWLGDEHTGGYSEDVFNDFTYLLSKRYEPVGTYIRSDFNEAVNNFDANSIDLLHIDGLHTYEAVKNDYETWKDKITNNGVILFHDTMVKENNFGVWKLWEEISPQFTSYEFKHTYGLGVIALGDETSNPLVRLLRIVNGNENLKKMFELHFTRLGELLCESALNKLKTEGERARSNDNIRFMPQIAYGRLDKMCDRLKTVIRKYSPRRLM